MKRLPPLLLFTLIGCAESESTDFVDVIPVPSAVAHGEGTFRITRATTVHVESSEMVDVVARQVALLRRSTGFPLADASGGGATRITVTAEASVPAEGYLLSITPEVLAISASTEAGVFYAFQTIRLMLPPQVESETTVVEVDWTLPAVTMEDAPRFPYRGMHLDVGRHFFDVAFIKKYIDTMARPIV